MFIFIPELHAAWRTKEHRCSPGRIFSNTNTKDMQVSSAFEGSLFFVPAYFTHGLFKELSFMESNIL
jgi:hypothetical protein